VTGISEVFCVCCIKISLMLMKWNKSASVETLTMVAF